MSGQLHASETLLSGEELPFPVDRRLCGSPEQV
jgi:hypothetical protein